MPFGTSFHRKKACGQETRTRSFLKGISFKALEVCLEVGVFFFLTGLFLHSFFVVLAIEAGSFLIYYMNERIWNKIAFGRASKSLSEPEESFRREKEKRLERLRKEIEMGRVDKELIDYLERLNSFPFIVTTQSCCGHGEDPKAGRRAYIDFRTSLSFEEVVSKILSPLERKYPELSFQLFGVRVGKPRFCVWLDNKEWREQLEYFIRLLEEIEEGS